MKRSGAIFDEMLFPGGKLKAFTASYDDGTIHDRKLVAIFNKYGIKGTFNLNAGLLGLERTMGPVDISCISEEEVKTLYIGHEVAGHGYNHASPINIGTSAYMYETIEDKKELERITGKLVRGYAYPFGMYNPDVKEVLRLAGYHYARVVDTTDSFDIPADFLELRGTAHHKNPRLMELAEEFCREGFFTMRNKLFYLWGHSYEFAGDNNWDLIENFCKYMQEHGEHVWFATNSEIVDYVNAFRSLEYSAEANMVYNPTGLEIWFKRGKNVYSVKPFETITVD